MANHTDETKILQKGFTAVEITNIDAAIAFRKGRIEHLEALIEQSRDQRYIILEEMRELVLKKRAMDAGNDKPELSKD
jgi:hypothetical protein